MTTASKEVERWLASPPWTPQFSMTGFARRHVGGNAGEGAVCGGVIGRSERAVKGCHQYRHRSCLDWPMMTATTETKDSQVVNNTTGGIGACSDARKSAKHRLLGLFSSACLSQRVTVLPQLVWLALLLLFFAETPRYKRFEGPTKENGICNNASHNVYPCK